MIMLEYVDARWHKVFRHYFGKHDAFTAAYLHAQNNPVPGIICPPNLLSYSGTYPLLHGVDNVSFFTEILYSLTPVVRNYTEQLTVSDFAVWDDGTEMLLRYDSIHVPCGLGTTLCLSEQQTPGNILHRRNDHSGRGCDYDSDSPDALPIDDVPDVSDNDCQNVGTVDESESLLMDLKLMYYEIVNIVESDTSLQKVALLQFTSVHNQVTQLFAEKSVAEMTEEAKANKKAKIVSSNVQSETMDVRKRCRVNRG